MNFNNNLLNHNNENEWEPEIHDEKYINATIYDYTFQIIDYHTGSRHFIRVIDKYGKDCIHMYYDIIEDEPAELTLYGLSFKPTCLIGRDMHRGKPTDYMIKVLLMYAMKELPQFDIVTLKDLSHFECILPENKHSIEIDLPTHNFFVYGKTWYERKFGAKLYEFPEFEKKLEAAVQKLHTHIDISFEQFMKNTFNHIGVNRIRAKWYTTVMKDIKQLYSSDKTWIQFFYDLFSKDPDAYITKKYGSQMACMLFYQCMKYLVNMFDINNLQGYDWYISRNTIESYDEFTNVRYSQVTYPTHIRNSGIFASMKQKLNALLYFGGSRNKTRKQLPKFPKMYTGLGGYYLRKSYKNTLRKKYRCTRDGVTK